jgi:hypothetical protein
VLKKEVIIPISHTYSKGRMPKYGGKLSTEEMDALVQRSKALNKK